MRFSQQHFALNGWLEQGKNRKREREKILIHWGYFIAILLVTEPAIDGQTEKSSICSGILCVFLSLYCIRTKFPYIFRKRSHGIMKSIFMFEI